MKRISQRNLLPRAVKNRNMDNLVLGGFNNLNGTFTLRDEVGDDKITMDKDGMVINDGSLTIKDAANQTIIDSFGLVSTASFTSGSVVGSVLGTSTGSTGFSDIDGAEISLTLTRESRVLVMYSASMNNTSASSGTTTLVRPILNGSNTLNGDPIGTTLINSGIPYSGGGGGVMSATGASSMVLTMPVGVNTLKLQVASGGVGTAFAGSGTITYVVLGT